jgi:hypothetical protein
MLRLGSVNIKLPCRRHEKLVLSWKSKLLLLVLLHKKWLHHLGNLLARLYLFLCRGILRKIELKCVKFPILRSAICAYLINLLFNVEAHRVRVLLLLRRTFARTVRRRRPKLIFGVFFELHVVQLAHFHEKIEVLPCATFLLLH